MSAPSLATVEAMREAWSRLLLQDRREPPEPRTYAWASALHACTRQIALDMAHPEDREAAGPESLSRMKRGKDRARDLLRDLELAGEIARPSFEVVGREEHFTIKDRDGRMLMSGKIDCRLRFSGEKLRPVAEIKSGQSFQHCETLEDLDRGQWTEHAADQLLSYMYGKSEPMGLFIIDRPGIPAFIPVFLEDHLERVERNLRRVRQASLAAEGKEDLPAFTEDRSRCARCDHFGKHCAPPVDFGEGVQVITDPVLVELARVKLETDEARRAGERAHEKLSKKLRGNPLVILGDVQITGKWQPDTRTVMPPRLAEAVKRRFSVTKEQGKWIMEYSSLAPAAEPAAEGADA